MTLRKFAAKVRAEVGEKGKVTAKTVSFSGFGYGDQGFVTITCPNSLDPSLQERLRQLLKESEVNSGKFIIELAGPAYPFGGTIKNFATR